MSRCDTLLIALTIAGHGTCSNHGHSASHHHFVDLVHTLFQACFWCPTCRLEQYLSKVLPGLCLRPSQGLVNVTCTCMFPLKQAFHHTYRNRVQNRLYNADHIILKQTVVCTIFHYFQINISGKYGNNEARFIDIAYFHKFRLFMLVHKYLNIINLLSCQIKRVVPPTGQIF